MLRLLAIAGCLAMLAPWCCCAARTVREALPADHACCDRHSTQSDQYPDCGCDEKGAPEWVQASGAMTLDLAPAHAVIESVMPLASADLVHVSDSPAVRDTRPLEHAPPRVRMHLRCHILRI
jgi:hypothetical protein